MFSFATGEVAVVASEGAKNQGVKCRETNLSPRQMIVPEGSYMFIRRLVIGALMAAARNPVVQRKAGEAASRAVDQARPKLIEASRRAGELTRKAHDKLRDMTDPK